MTNILIIDDDAAILDVCQHMLTREGYRVVGAQDGDRGIEICHEEPIEIVITDILMPQKEGLETILELKEAFPNLKMIAMSGGGRLEPDGYLIAAEKMGAHSTIKKPFTRRDLLNAVRGVLHNGAEP
jgi:DNA-binding NtrC family response regulator